MRLGLQLGYDDPVASVALAEEAERRSGEVRATLRAELARGGAHVAIDTPRGGGVTPLAGGAAVARGVPGVVHGMRSYLMQDEYGQVEEAHSISAGLDYPGIGPEHAWLADIGRIKFLSATDQEALEAFKLCSQLEGIIPALEPAHAIAKVAQLAPKMATDHLMVVNLSGRGDKDLASVAEYLSGHL